jgi:hypothetical protein
VKKKGKRQMRRKNGRTRRVIFRVVGVLMVIGLMAGAVYIGYRLGWQRGMVAAGSEEVFSMPEASLRGLVPFHGYPIFFPGIGSLFGVFLVFLLVGMAVKFLVGPFHFRPRPYAVGRFCHWRWHRLWDDMPPEVKDNASEDETPPADD